jgi:REP element-mobilizing transposase RayT
LKERNVVLAYHIVFGCYGFWLPNDPRGSWSTYVGSRPLRFFGPATKTELRRSVAHAKHNVARRRLAKSSLQKPVVRFTGQQALEVARGFGAAAEASAYETMACAILPDHVHLVVRRHERHVKRIAGHFKSLATRQLRSAQWFVDCPVWADGSWAVFLNSIEDIERATRYVVNNPVREGFKLQRWSFVRPYSSSI